ncbi:MAG: MATE family efflux transporter [Clostridiales bacterium]|nr:MATE family efflux transporter [Clostridiales bacterium]
MEDELFEKTPVHRAYFTLALPVVFGMVISVVYNMVDTYFIAGTGNTMLVAGVSIGAPVFTLMIALGDIFGLGGSSLVSRLFGEKRDEEGKRISAFCFYAALVLGVAVTVVMLLFQQSILTVLGADADTYQYAADYYKWIVIGAPFIILSFTPSNLLRTEGYAKASMVGTVLGSVINIILDPIFISVLGLGAAGAAIATVLGNVAADGFYLWFLLHKSRKLSVLLKDARIEWAFIPQILAIGIPASITNLMQSFGTALLNRYLLLYGSDKVAAMGIAMKVNLIAVLIMVGFAFGGQPLIGYNYGAKNNKRFKQVLRFAYLFEIGIAGVLTVVICLLAPSLIRLFMKEQQIVDMGSRMLRCQQIGMVFIAIVLVSTCTFQAAGKALGALLLSVSRQGVVFAVVLYCANRLWGCTGVLVSQAISDFLTAALAAALCVKMIKEIERQRK